MKYSKKQHPKSTNQNVEVQGTVISRTAKSIVFKSQRGNRASLPISQIKTLSGTLKEGAAVTLRVPKWLIDKAREENALIRVTGICKGMTDKSIKVTRDADGVTCPLPYSLAQIETEVIEGEQITALVPAWVLRKRDKSLPSWVQGARA